VQRGITVSRYVETPYLSPVRNRLLKRNDVPDWLKEALKEKGTHPYRASQNQVYGPSLPWQEWALCKGTDIGMWYPERGHPPAWIEQSKALCRQCPVRWQCLEMALATHQDYGIWGGTTPPKRRQLKRLLYRMGIMAFLEYGYLPWPDDTE
jgi:WhiB family redox-sensing transcriptional regulator